MRFYVFDFAWGGWIAIRPYNDKAKISMAAPAGGRELVIRQGDCDRVFCRQVKTCHYECM